MLQIVFNKISAAEVSSIPTLEQLDLLGDFQVSESTLQTLDDARFGKMGILAVEMEAAGLYCTAAYAGKRALAICSISDNLVTGKELSADERQTTFTNMMKIALEVAVKMENKE